VDAVAAKLSNRNQMVLPKQARAALGLKPGDRVLVIVDDGEVRLLPAPKDWGAYVRGQGKEAWESLGGGERFLNDERSFWEQTVSD
jgi:AbrB family looped-hinge helix DNA binding protein